MKSQILKRNTDKENGIESRLIKTERGLVVGIWDMDENESYGDVIIFPFDMNDHENKAQEYYNKINSNNGNSSIIIL